MTDIIEKRVFATSQLPYFVYPFKVKWRDSDTSLRSESFQPTEKLNDPR